MRSPWNVLGREKSWLIIAWLHRYVSKSHDFSSEAFYLVNVIIYKVAWSVWAAQDSLKE